MGDLVARFNALEVAVVRDHTECARDRAAIAALQMEVDELREESTFQKGMVRALSLAVGTFGIGGIVGIIKYLGQ
jgi:hypothetical protein